jgi:hypothetical protein
MGKAKGRPAHSRILCGRPVGTGDLAAIYSSLGGGPVDDSRARIYSVTDACRLAAGMVDACSRGRPAVPTITAVIATTIRRRRI